MRQISFRGKTEGGEWLYGSLERRDQVDRIGAYEITDPTYSDPGGDTVWIYDSVIRETVGQFTGLKDKNGVGIYEGDVLRCHEYDSSDTVGRIVQTFENAVVGFYSGSFYYFPGGNMKQPHQLLMYAYKPVIVGNIHDNPELLTPPLT